MGKTIVIKSQNSEARRLGSKSCLCNLLVYFELVVCFGFCFWCYLDKQNKILIISSWKYHDYSLSSRYWPLPCFLCLLAFPSSSLLNSCIPVYIDLIAWFTCHAAWHRAVSQRQIMERIYIYIYTHIHTHTHTSHIQVWTKVGLQL